MLSISANDMTYYEVKAYMDSLGGGHLLAFTDALWLTLPDGMYWSGTKLACTTQIVIIIKDGVKSMKKWDKTFKAKAVVKIP